MKPKVFQYIVLSLLLFFCTSACNDSDARENSNQPLPSTPEEGQVEEAGPFMRGTTYEERGKSLIDCMLRVSPGKGYSIKYLAPFYYARLWSNHETAEATAKLIEIYQYQLEHIDEVYHSDSDLEFFVHATMHGYMLTKTRMSEQLQKKIKDFMKLGKYATDKGTLNMRMMRQASGFLCAEEWSDFVDADGQTSSQLKSYLHGRILKTLKSFFTDNCPEADAFTYLGINLQYVRMLAEFSRDEEIRKTAATTYQHMVAQLLLPWNQGLYCANPSRCKGWANLCTGNLSVDVQIGQLAWLFYGGQNERKIRLDAGKDNFACFNFWMAYQRNVKPLPYLQSLNAGKQYPYHFEALRINDDHFCCRYTYQSKNYGLSTQTIEAFSNKLKGFQYTYAFKETKNLHLVWQSDLSEASVFSVCHDNPERPQSYQTVSNKPGYGENPYHRVLGYERSAIGVYNVAEDYMDQPKFYQMYVPFTRKGIKTKMIREINGMRWVLCHTGSMMFAFATPEDWDFGLQDNKYGIKDHHILTLKDVNRRRGSWVLETTEITERYKDAQGDMDAELKKFAGDIATKVKLQLSADYETSDTPSISYTNFQGDVLELTFFSPEMSYNGQYKVNGNAVDLNTEYISKSDYMQQKAGSNSVQFHTATGTETLQLE